MLLSRTGALHRPPLPPGAPCGRAAAAAAGAARRPSVAAAAKRGRPRKSETATTTTDAAPAPEPLAGAADAAPKRRRGRPPAAGAPPATDAQAPAAAQTQPGAQAAEHERIISYEVDITSSLELDYTDNPTLIVPSYTHQAQGHEAATQPPLDNYLPDYQGSGFVRDEEVPQLALPQQPGAQLAQPATAAPLAPAPPQQQQPQLPEQPWQQPAEQLPGVMQQPQLAVAQAAGAAAAAGAAESAADEDEDEFLGEEPPGLFDFEAGRPFADTEPEPQGEGLRALPPEFRPRNRREADYLLRWANWTTNLEREWRMQAYEDKARMYQSAQLKESENIYLTGKALAVVTAEIEQEDVAAGNRRDGFYPVWARAEHRWYPSGRFAAYNAYVKDNIAELTVKFAPGADQAEDFDIMDDVLLMADEGAEPDGSGGGGDDDGGGGGPAAGLDLDTFMGPGLLPGAATSELGAAFLDDVLGGGAGGGGGGEEQLADEELE